MENHLFELTTGLDLAFDPDGVDDGGDGDDDDDIAVSDEQLIRKALGMESTEEEGTITKFLEDEKALEKLFALDDHLANDDTSTTNHNEPVLLSLPEKESQQEIDSTDITTVTPEPEKRHTLTGRCPTILYLSCDPDNLSEYQCLVRKQIELFEANETAVLAGAQGRNKPIVLGQVGIRCRHCSFVPISSRGRSAVFYPSKLVNVYQASQNIATHHLQDSCLNIPVSLKNDLCSLKDKKTRARGGKEHWAKTAEALGVYDDADGLRYVPRTQH